MKKKKSIVRNEFDYLITDTLPAEMPAPFSFIHFYHWLNDPVLKQGIKLRKVIGEKRKDAKYPGSDYASFPHRFLVLKKDGSVRTLSCPTLMGAVLMMAFVLQRQKEFLYDFSKPSFSIRRHTPVSSLTYFKLSGKGKRRIIHYISDFDHSPNELMEKTGMFFEIKPIHTLSALWKSNIWKRTWEKFSGQKCIHIDIENCFPSVYTHTFGWFFPHEGAESKAFSGSNDYHNALDRVVERINSNETRGVMVGPEFSRLAVETLLIEIDSRVILRLEREYRLGVDYQVLRFIDDYYIFGKDEATRNAVQKCIEEVCRNFFLRLNASKKEEMAEREEEKWTKSVSEVINILDELMVRANPSTSKRSFLLQSKLAFDSLVRLSKEFGEKHLQSITAYIFSAFTRKLRNRKVCKRLFALPCVSIGYYNELFSFLFSMCRHGARYFNFQSLALMIHGIMLFSPTEKKNMIVAALQSVMHQDENTVLLNRLCCDQGIYDLLPLILEITAVDVILPKKVMSNLSAFFSKTVDPVLLGCAVLLYKKMRKNSLLIETMERVNGKLDSFLSGLFLDKHKKSAFLFPDFWYVLIFNRYGSLNKKTQSNIDGLINCIKSQHQGNEILQVVCDYLLDPTYKVFDWDFFSPSSQRKWHYVTGKRMSLVKGSFYV